MEDLVEDLENFTNFKTFEILEISQKIQKLGKFHSFSIKEKFYIILFFSRETLLTNF